MRGAVLYGAGDVRVEEREDPKILEPMDAILLVTAACVCGSDLWLYRGVETYPGPQPMGHEYVGIVEEVGREVRSVKPGQFVVGSFWATDNTCPICQAGYQSRCVQAVPMGALGAQAPFLRVPLADGTLVGTPESSWSRSSAHACTPTTLVTGDTPEARTPVRRTSAEERTMPHVIVKLWPGKSEQQKQELAERIAENVMRVLGYGEESVSVAMEEVEAEDWAEQVYRPDILENADRLYKKPGYQM